MKLKAFTLAEVLITLGIIGVVAAITIPGLISNYQKKQTVTKLEKVYSILNQAIKLSEEEFDSIESWDRDMNNIEFFNKYLRPHMNVSAVAKLGEYKNTPKYKRLNGTVENSFTLFYNDANLITLNDGCLLFLNSDSYKLSNQARNPVIIPIGIDINGFSHPNVIGKDFFLYNIIVDYNGKFNPPKIVPYGAYNTSDFPFGEYKRENTKKGTYACTKAGRGQFCAALIMMDNWQISSDYPW